MPCAAHNVCIASDVNSAALSEIMVLEQLYVLINFLIILVTFSVVLLGNANIMRSTWHKEAGSYTLSPEFKWSCREGQFENSQNLLRRT